MVLETLAALGAQHGYAIANRLEQVAGGGLEVNMGTLYPALQRLEQRAWIKGAWAQTEANRRARFYSLTARGRKQLEAERAQWQDTVAMMRRLVEDVHE